MQPFDLDWWLWSDLAAAHLLSASDASMLLLSHIHAVIMGRKVTRQRPGWQA